MKFKNPSVSSLKIIAIGMTLTFVPGCGKSLTGGKDALKSEFQNLLTTEDCPQSFVNEYNNLRKSEIISGAESALGKDDYVGHKKRLEEYQDFEKTTLSTLQSQKECVYRSGNTEMHFNAKTDPLLVKSLKIFNLKLAEQEVRVQIADAFVEIKKSELLKRLTSRILSKKDIPTIESGIAKLKAIPKASPLNSSVKDYLQELEEIQDFVVDEVAAQTKNGGGGDGDGANGIVGNPIKNSILAACLAAKASDPKYTEEYCANVFSSADPTEIRFIQKGDESYEEYYKFIDLIFYSMPGVLPKSKDVDLVVSLPRGPRVANRWYYEVELEKAIKATKVHIKQKSKELRRATKRNEILLVSLCNQLIKEYQLLEADLVALRNAHTANIQVARNAELEKYEAILAGRPLHVIQQEVERMLRGIEQYKEVIAEQSAKIDALAKAPNGEVEADRLKRVADQQKLKNERAQNQRDRNTLTQRKVALTQVLDRVTHVGYLPVHELVKKGNLALQNQAMEASIRFMTLVLQNFQAGEYHPVLDDTATVAIANLGFKNLGMTCFANSAKQLFLAHPKLAQTLDPDVNELNLAVNPETHVVESLESLNRRKGLQLALQGLSDTYHQTKNGTPRNDHFEPELHNVFDNANHNLIIRNRISENNPVLNDPYFMINALTGAKDYLRKDMLDPQEYLGFLLDLLEFPKVIGNVQLKPEVVLENGRHYLSKMEPAVRWTDPFSILQLEVITPENKEFRSVAESISTTFAFEWLDGENKILDEHDNVKRAGYRRNIMLAKHGEIPQAMIIQLKRFKMDAYQQARKVSHKVKINTILDFEFVESDAADAVDIENLSIHRVSMKPTAVVIHRGHSPAGGHYVAYVYHEKWQTWVLHDDSSTTPIRTAEELADAYREMESNGYLVLYTAI